MEMKIEPKKDYKKPLYAIGVAAVIGATALLGTACTDDPIQYGGETETMATKESEIMLGGFAPIPVQTDETKCCSKPDADETEVQWMGEVAEPDT